MRICFKKGTRVRNSYLYTIWIYRISSLFECREVSQYLHCSVLPRWWRNFLVPLTTVNSPQPYWLSDLQLQSTALTFHSSSTTDLPFAYSTRFSLSSPSGVTIQNSFSYRKVLGGGSYAHEPGQCLVASFWPKTSYLIEASANFFYKCLSPQPSVTFISV